VRTVPWRGAQAERVAAAASFLAACVSDARAAAANEVVCRRELKEFRSATILHTCTTQQETKRAGCACVSRFNALTV
jgi:hypothetical protein